ncbi:hypothetical protein [uncultured Psychrobacter sp.]|uniref:hypothetical protein n=1 Tax=uncultured Psychrobacter sp. TaxID=259303 RepID=UPI00259A303C|nr:hypothetical protein [uncultured Psychrobacter sp.]
MNEPNRPSTTLELIVWLGLCHCRSGGYGFYSRLSEHYLSGFLTFYGIWLIILAPIVMIWFFGRDNEHWLAKDSG